MNRATLILTLTALAAASCAQAQERPRRLTGRDSHLRVVEPDAEDNLLRTTPVVRAVQKAADSVVSVYLVQQDRLGRPQPKGQGSGVILDESGFVITNWHVVVPVLQNESLSLQIHLRDGRKRSAQVLSSSADHDLALIQLQLEGNEEVVPVEIGTSSELMMGETVIAIGNPQGHANTVTSGVLSASDRSIRVVTPDRQRREYKGLLQTDAAINEGNSGGALLDITGKLIGINNAMAVGAENIGFAIPVDTVRKVFENELISSASLAASTMAIWLGMQVADEGGRVVVAEVEPLGPAATAGLQKGDTLVSVGDAEVNSSLDYTRRVLGARSGSALPMLVQRDGERLQLRPVPLPKVQADLIALVGIEANEVRIDRTDRTDPNRELVRRATLLFYSDTAYRRVPLLPAILDVTKVYADGPAAQLGIKVGDYIIGVVREDRRGREIDLPVESARSLVDTHLRPLAGRWVQILLMRGEKDMTGDLDIRRPRKI